MAERDTPTLPGTLIGLKMAAGAVIHRGHLVQINEFGYARNANGAGPVVGVACATVDDDGGQVNGAKSVVVRPGIYRLDNDSQAPVTQLHVGQPCYVVSSDTVSSSSDGESRGVAGTVLGVDIGVGVWVKTGL
jgi:hypothetical protein